MRYSLDRDWLSEVSWSFQVVVWLPNCDCSCDQRSDCGHDLSTDSSQWTKASENYETLVQSVLTIPHDLIKPLLAPPLTSPTDWCGADRCCWAAIGLPDCVPDCLPDSAIFQFKTHLNFYVSTCFNSYSFGPQDCEYEPIADCLLDHLAHYFEIFYVCCQDAILSSF